MELTLSYFWAIKLTLLGITLFAAYKALYLHNFESKLWNVIFGALLLFAFFNPIRMENQTRNVQVMQSKSIESSKVLPPKIQNDSFKNKVNSIKSITKEELE